MEMSVKEVVDKLRLLNPPSKYYFKRLNSDSRHLEEFIKLAYQKGI